MNAQHIMKMEKPRSLKTSNMSGHSMESVLTEMDLVSQKLNGTILDRSTSALITSLCENLKKFGLQLESIYKDQLDRCYVTLRNGCRDDRLPLPSRYRLLEVIELRAMNWQPNENLINYYQQKLVQIEAEEAYLEKSPETEMGTCINTVGVIPSGMYQSYPAQFAYTPQNSQIQQSPLSTTVPGTPVMLDPGELVKSSGKFVVPARVPGKNHLKDEIVIRNADSGKVMGLKGRRVHMIEELSETIISLQRVNPGARERLVQITGASEENIRKARQLIEETIRRNASPTRTDEKRSQINAGSSCSSISSHASDDILQGPKRDSQSEGLGEEAAEYRYTVTHDHDTIRITGSNLELVKAAKLVLDEYFRGEKNLNSIVFERSSGGTYCGSTKSCSEALRKNVDDERDSEGRPPPPPSSGVVTVLRQPLTPSSAKEMFDFADASNTADMKNVKNRRFMFAKTNEEKSNSQSSDVDSYSVKSGQSGGFQPSGQSRISYSREFLLRCAASVICRTKPASLDKCLHPSIPIVKKPNNYFDPFKLLSCDLKWCGIQTVPTGDEEDNGNNANEGTSS